MIALVGDGAMQMNGINELITLMKYRHRFVDPRLIILVLNNRDLNMVTWEQRGTEGNPRFEASQDVPEFDYARYAQLVGMGACGVSAPDAMAAAWQQALSADRPFLIDAHTDPDVPLIPPHVSAKQAKAFASSLMKEQHTGALLGKVWKELHP